MSLKKTSYSYIKTYLWRQLKQAHRENMALASDAGIVPRERAAVRISVLEELCREFDVHLIEMKQCQRGVCAFTFPNLGAGKKYCSDACRQAAYRDRHFL